MAAVHYHSLPIHHRHPQIPIHSSSSLTKSFSFLPPPPSSSSSRKHAISVAARVADDPSTASPHPSPPEIELEFLGPKPGVDGTYPVDRVKAKSGEKLLRNIMLENKIELYATYMVEMWEASLSSYENVLMWPTSSWQRCPTTLILTHHYNTRAILYEGKVMNCGGGGSCGTCIVEIIDGNDLLNERTNTEERYLKKKPDSWRLACQTIVGNKENAGKVVVQRLPQWKK